MSLFRAEHTDDQVLDGAPVVSGNLVVDGTLTVDGATTHTGGIVGTTAGGNATAGNVGEYVITLVAVGSPVSLTTATAANVASISLTAGDWDVEGNVNFTAGSATTATTSAWSAGIDATTATLPTDGSEVHTTAVATTSSFLTSIPVPRKRISLSATTTIYLVGLATFSAGTVGGYGKIAARRMR